MQTDLAHSEELTLPTYKYHNTTLNLKWSCCNPNNSLKYTIQFKILKTFKDTVALPHYSENLNHLISHPISRKVLAPHLTFFSIKILQRCSAVTEK